MRVTRVTQTVCPGSRRQMAKCLQKGMGVTCASSTPERALSGPHVAQQAVAVAGCALLRKDGCQCLHGQRRWAF